MVLWEVLEPILQILEIIVVCLESKVLVDFYSKGLGDPNPDSVQGSTVHPGRYWEGLSLSLHCMAPVDINNGYTAGFQ